MRMPPGCCGPMFITALAMIVGGAGWIVALLVGG